VQGKKLLRGYIMSPPENREVEQVTAAANRLGVGLIHPGLVPSVEKEGVVPDDKNDLSSLKNSSDLGS